MSMTAMMMLDIHTLLNVDKDTVAECIKELHADTAHATVISDSSSSSSSSSMDRSGAETAANASHDGCEQRTTA